MATSKNRWELEEKRKKQQLLQNALDKANVGATAEKLSNAAQTIKKNTTTKSSSTGSTPTVTAPKTNTSAITPAKSTAAKTSVFQELPKLAGTVQKTAQTVLQSTQKNNDLRQLQKNSIAWHGTTDAATRSSLQRQNDMIRQKLGLSFDPKTGATFDAKTGINYSTPTQLLFGSSAGQRANTAAQFAANTMPTMARQLAERNPAEDKSISERVLETIEASTKRVRAGLDNWFATGNVAADEETEQKYLAGDELGWLDQLRMKDRWGENWESYLSGVRDAYRTGDTEIIEEYEKRAKEINSLYDTTPLFDEAAQQAEGAKTGLGTVGRTALDALGMGADMLGAASIASTGGGGAGLFTGVSSVSAAGQAADQARRMGASAAQQEDYGNAVGALNFAVERLGGIGGGEAASKIASRILPEAVQNAAGKATSTAVGRVLAGGAEEGLEGAIQSEGERALRNAILGANEAFDPAEFGANIGYNALMGSVFRGGQEVSGAVRNRMLSTSVNTDPAVHTPEQMAKINEYVHAVDDGLLNFIQKRRSGELWKKAKYIVAQVDARMKNDIKNTIGVDTDGYTIVFDVGSDEHIERRHGANGAANHSMQDIEDIARLPYVVQNYDELIDLHDTTAKVSNSDNTPAKIVQLLKRIDGTYYVVEAVPDSARKEINVISAYLEKAKQQPTPGQRSTTNGLAPLSSRGAVDNSISQSEANINQQETNSQALGRRMAELDAQKRLAETVLPGPIRDRAIQQAENEMRQVQQQAQATQTATTAQTPPQAEVQIPADAVFQYGLSPEAAALEARERARNEAAQEAQDANKTINLDDAIRQWDNQKTQQNDISTAEKLKNAVRYAHRNIVSGQAEIERFAKQQQKINPNAASANDLSQISRTAGSTVDTIAEKALVNRKGDVIGDSWLNTVKGLTEAQLKQLNFYRLHKHNVDRMSLWERTASQRIKAAADKETLENYFPFLTNTSSAALEDMARNNESKEIREVAREYLNAVKDLDYWQKIKNKPVIGRVSDEEKNIPYTADESANIVREMEAKNPQLKQWAQKAAQFHDTFMHEWAVGSGLMSEEQFQMLKERYPNYVQTYRVQDNWGGDADVKRRGSVNTGSPIKEAVGDISEIIPFEDAEMMQVNSLVKTARRNELFQNIYAFAKENPAAAAPYVRVTGEDIEYKAPESIDDLTGELADAAMSEQGGIYTIRAMVDGKPIVMQVNADFYAGLQNLFGQDKGSSDSFMKKTFGTATNVFKQLTTGRNPLFFLTNLPKDFQTAYINTTSDRKLLLTYLADVAGTIKSMAKNSAEWNTFQSLGGTSSGFYHNEKGFTQSAKDAEKHKILKKLWSGVDAISENTEALWRFNEYRAAIKKYGDTQDGRAKAIQAAADITTNFSRSAPATKAAENYCAYLNASVQGLDKMARQLKNHPFTTTRRAAEIIALPTLLLYLVNRDDEDYQDLNNRTKDNYFCIPLGDSGKFLKIPKSREYGVAMGALLERFFRLAEGEEAESAFRGIADQFFTNLAPSNPVTDNILKTVFIDLPTNRDFAGRSIVPERMSGLSPENQYDYSTSGAGMAIANAWNKTGGSLLGKISPMQVDYLLDSNLGFVGDAILGATTNPKSWQEIAKEFKEDPRGTVFAPFLNVLEQKFVADPMYQSGVTDTFYAELDAAEKAKNDKNLIDSIAADVVTPEEKYYSELSKASGEISDLRKQERELLADRSLTDEQREAQVREIRRQINDIAKAAPENARKVRDEYAKTYIPEISYLEGDRYEQAQEAILHGVSAQQFADTDKRLKDLTNEKDEKGDKVRSDAEARAIVLDEVMQDGALTDSEKQAIADYVLISTLGDKQREDWETVAKGKVNATDFLRFKSDISAYEEGAKGTGTDNMANVATILRGYDGLTDEQRDVLFQTYNDTMSNNPFHVSVYEQAITENSLYQSLTEDGKAALRALTNEYEQHINEGRELDEWRAKAYMAEKEAGIAPGIYALYRTVLETVNAQNDGNTNRSQQEVETAINTIPGLTQYQKAYIWQSANKEWKKNPFGSATVTKYNADTQEAINPVAGGTLSSSFGPRTSPTAGASSWHKAVDIAAPEGTPVQAVKGGTVTSAGWVNGYGWTVHIDHGDGTETEYHHMQAQSDVQPGDTVTQGQKIGAVGSTGISTGPHLDLQAWKDGKIIDPLTIIPEYGSASGYVYDGSVASGVISSGVSAAQNEKASSSSKKTGLDTLDTYKSLKSLWM